MMGNKYKKALSSFFIKERPFTLKEVAAELSISASHASKVLYRLKQQGHILPLKKGVYLPVSHKGLSPTETFGDPWIIVPALFPNAYIGGWTAANHWGLTEQLFRTTLLMSKKEVSHRSVKVGPFDYNLFKSKNTEAFGADKTWRENVQVPISDVHRTVIDMIENPTCGGGIQHTIDCFKVYMKDHYEEPTFLEYSKKIKNGSYFKRLGYIIETWFGPDHPLCKVAKGKITTNYIPIDSHMPCEQLITKWRLFINKDIAL